MLPLNALVTVTISKDLLAELGYTLDSGVDYVFQFTTQYEPLFTSTLIIRGEIGGIISDISDDTINLLIFENSRLANYTFNTEYTSEDAPYEIRQWTKCKTEYDLLHGKLLKLLGSAGHGQSDIKRLGDLSISRTLGGTGSDFVKGLQPALDKADKCMKFFASIISPSNPQVAIKGSAAVVGITPQDIRGKRNWSMSTTRSTANTRWDRGYRASDISRL